MNTKRIVILGGGFAGIQAARALSRRGLPATIIDRNSYTTMLPVLPDVASGWIPDSVAVCPVSEVIPAHCRFEQAAVTAVDLAKSKVTTDSGSIDYDYLLLATGSRTRQLTASDTALPFLKLDCLQDAIDIRTRLTEVFTANQAPVLIFIGAGYTGLELALGIAAFARSRQRPRTRLVMLEKSPVILPFLPPAMRHYVTETMASSGVELITEAEITRLTDRKVFLSNGDHFSYSLLFNTTGSQAASQDFTSRLERYPAGRVKVNSFLQAENYDNVFVAGDEAALQSSDGALIRKAVNFAYYSGCRAGRNISATVAGGRMRSFRPLDLGWVIPLHQRAIGQLFSKLYIRGKLPLRLHYFMCGFRHYSWCKRYYFFSTSLALPGPGD